MIIFVSDIFVCLHVPINHEVFFFVCVCVASLDKISVEIEGQTYPLKQIAQLGMPNPQTLLVNMSAYPEVRIIMEWLVLLNTYILDHD